MVPTEPHPGRRGTLICSWRIFWRRTARRLSVAGRQRGARDEIGASRRIDAYERSENLRVQQAQRDLRDLVAAQVLEPVGRTRARYYIAGGAFPQAVLEEAGTPFTLTDPYKQ